MRVSRRKGSRRPEHSRPRTAPLPEIILVGGASNTTWDANPESPIEPAVRLLSGVVLSIALSLHHNPAHGQTAAGTGNSPPPTGPPAASSGAERSDAATIVVTGTRITSRGFTAPTPTTMVTSDDLTKTAQPNIFTSVAQLPSLQGSTGVATGTFSTSSGQQGLSSFSLRGLGAIRTLTLLDGQRVVGANVTGVPDISQFPQLLIQRVDIVNGGASTSYGSDAVGGVVNVVTDKRFEGFKTRVQGGITTYGDDGQFLLGAAAGHSLFDDRLHLEGSVEYDHENGVPARHRRRYGYMERTTFTSAMFM